MIRTKLLEALESLQEALTRTDRIDAVAVRLDTVERRVDTVERRLAGLTDLTGQVANLREDVDQLDAAVATVSQSQVDALMSPETADARIADLWTAVNEQRVLIDQQRPLAMRPNNGPTVRQILEDG